jgi:hypothetical protein
MLRHCFAITLSTEHWKTHGILLRDRANLMQLAHQLPAVALDSSSSKNTPSLSPYCCLDFLHCISSSTAHATYHSLHNKWIQVAVKRAKVQCTHYQPSPWTNLRLLSPASDSYPSSHSNGHVTHLSIARHIYPNLCE